MVLSLNCLFLDPLRYFFKPNVLYNAIIITTDQYSPQNQLKDRLYVKRAGGILVTPAVMDHAM